MQTGGNVELFDVDDLDEMYSTATKKMTALYFCSRWSVESIHVVVLDENDHAPKFPQRFRNISVAESADVGSQLIQIQAFDLDASNPSALAQTEVAVFCFILRYHA